ncbi:ceramide kinase-like protein [Styela clava]
MEPRSGWEVFDSPKSQTPENVEDVSLRQNGRKEAFIETISEKKNETKLHSQNEIGEDKITSLFQATSSHRSVDVTFPPHHLSSSNQRVSRPSSAIPRVSPTSEDRSDGVILSAIFAVDKISYDVELFDDRIVWTPVTPGKTKKPVSESHQDLPMVDKGMIYLHEICSVRLKNIKSIRSGSITTIGFAIFTAQSKSGNKLREQSMLFLCFSREICIQWASRIKAAITARVERPKRLLILSSGSIQSRMMWDDMIDAKIQMACIKGQLVEIVKPNSVTEYIQKMLAEQSVSRDAESYDGILMLGKIGLFSEAVNAILQFKKEILRSGAWHPNIPTLGFIPTTSVSYISSEIHGCSDAETALFHALYGCTQTVPISSYYDEDGNFLKYGIVASYGFSGGDTTYDTITKGFGAIQSSIKKGFAFTKAIVQRRSYSCEIQYKDSPQSFEPFDEDELFQGEFKKYSIVNQFYVEDDDEQCHSRSSLHPPHDSDSGVWPQFDKWDTVPCRCYLDITVTSLPQNNDEFSDGCQLSATLVRETMSRKELLKGMGSQVSISSVMSQKNKSEIQDKTDVIRASEFVIKPTSLSSNGSSNSNSFSKWTIDGNCLDSKIQELHVKVEELPLIMYGRTPGQPLCLPLDQTILRLTSTPEDVALDSMA